jgi:hypothetical protein
MQDAAMALLKKYCGKERVPRCHLMIQVMAEVWRKAEAAKRSPSWGGITVTYIDQVCQITWAANPVWHEDLTDTNISWYLAGIPCKKMWWIWENIVTLDEDGILHEYILLNTNLMCSAVIMDGTVPASIPLPPSGEPSPVEPPSPVRNTRSKGKAHEQRSDVLEQPTVAKKRGKKQSAAQDYPDGQDDFEDDYDLNDDTTPKRGVTTHAHATQLPHVEVSVPSLPRAMHARATRLPCVEVNVPSLPHPSRAAIESGVAISIGSV